MVGCRREKEGEDGFPPSREKGRRWEGLLLGRGDTLTSILSHPGRGGKRGTPPSQSSPIKGEEVKRGTARPHQILRRGASSE